jgi:hypothetical protein
VDSFPEAVVDFRPVAGNEGKTLLWIVRQIRSETGREPSGQWLSAASPTFGGSARHPAAGALGPEDEQFVAAIRQALAELAAAVGVGALDDDRQRTVLAALDGAELVTRGQLALGRPEQLRMLLPSFVFLVALPIVEQDEALSLSRRAGELVDQHLGS